MRRRRPPEDPADLAPRQRGASGPRECPRGLPSPRPQAPRSRQGLAHPQVAGPSVASGRMCPARPVGDKHGLFLPAPVTTSPVGLVPRSRMRRPLRHQGLVGQLGFSLLGGVLGGGLGLLAMPGCVSLSPSRWRALARPCGDSGPCGPVGVLFTGAADIQGHPCSALWPLWEPGTRGPGFWKLLFHQGLGGDGLPAAPSLAGLIAGLTWWRSPDPPRSAAGDLHRDGDAAVAGSLPAHLGRVLPVDAAVRAAAGIVNALSEAALRGSSRQERMIRRPPLGRGPRGRHPARRWPLSPAQAAAGPPGWVPRAVCASAGHVTGQHRGQAWVAGGGAEGCGPGGGASLAVGRRCGQPPLPPASVLRAGAPVRVGPGREPGLREPGPALPPDALWGSFLRGGWLGTGSHRGMCPRPGQPLPMGPSVHQAPGVRQSPEPRAAWPVPPPGAAGPAASVTRCLAPGRPPVGDPPPHRCARSPSTRQGFVLHVLFFYCGKRHVP